MKAILLFSTVLFYHLGFTQTDWSIKYIVQGPVKTVRTTTFTEEYKSPIIFGYVESKTKDTVTDFNTTRTRIRGYNKRGLPACNIYVNTENDTVSYCTWEYDDRSRRIKQTNFGSDSIPTVTYTTEYLNDSVIIKEMILPDGSLYDHREEHVYCGKKVKQSFEKYDGRIENLRYEFLDDKCRPIESYRFNKDSVCVHFSKMKRSPNGHIIEKIYWNQDSTRFSHEKKRFSEIGRNTFIENFDSLGNSISTVTMEYNSNGDVILEIKKDKDGNVVTTKSYEYIYDRYRNWISKRSFINQDSYVYEFEKIIREIEYLF